MQELTLKINKDSKQAVYNVILPENWNELTQKQLIYIASVWHEWKQQISTATSLQRSKAALFIELINNPEAEKKKIIEALQHIDKNNDVNLFCTIDFIFNDITLTKQLLPTLSLGMLSKYYGPDDALGNISIGEFSFAIAFYNRYSRTSSTDDLNKLIAILYRPKSKTETPSGDIRKPFKKHFIEAYEIELRQLQFKYKQAVFLYFMGCMEAWSKRFPYVFSRADYGSGAPKPFINVIIELSGSKFGTFDQTFEQNAFIVLTELNNLLTPKRK